MTDPFTQLLEAASSEDIQTVSRLSGYLNCRDEDGATVLMHAVMSADLRAIEVLLQAGADPNFKAIEPASDYLAETTLSLAMQARFLMDYGKYNPVVERLLEAGATDDD